MKDIELSTDWTSSGHIDALTFSLQQEQTASKTRNHVQYTIMTQTWRYSIIERAEITPETLLHKRQQDGPLSGKHFIICH